MTWNRHSRKKGSLAGLSLRRWRFRLRILLAAGIALALAYLAVLLVFFGQIGWSLVALFAIAPLLALVLLGSQIAHIFMRGRS